MGVIPNNGHGGSRLLVELLIKEGDSHKNNFKDTLLRRLPKTYTPDEVIKVENLYNEKLGLLVFGLNAN